MLLPLALSIVGIVLSSLCLFAGRDRDFMEDYDIVRVSETLTCLSFIIERRANKASLIHQNLAKI